MAVPKKKLGAIPCPVCSHAVMVRENEAGTMTAACDGCDVSMFAKRGTDVQRLWAKKLGVQAAGTVPKEVPAAPEKAPAAPAPEPVPKAAAQKAGPFDFLIPIGGK